MGGKEVRNDRSGVVDAATIYVVLSFLFATMRSHRAHLAGGFATGTLALSILSL